MLSYVIKEWSSRAKVKLRRKFVACDKCEVPESQSSDYSPEESSPPSSPQPQHERKAEDKEYGISKDRDKEFHKFCFCPPDQPETESFSDSLNRLHETEKKDCTNVNLITDGTKLEDMT